LLSAAILLGCSDGSEGGGVLVTSIDAVSPTPETTQAAPTAVAAPTQAPNNGPPANGGSANAYAGFIMPIAGGCLPRGDQLIPNAPRPYRKGIHEGVDFYGSDNCTAIGKGTAVLAAKAGTVIRADLDYTDLTAADVTKYLADPLSDEALDKFRGRQVWVEHGRDAAGARVVTRYAHLSGIAPGITRGTQVAAGQLIAFVGESGTPESVRAPGSEYHLHFEIRAGDGFLGQGQAPAQVRALFQAAFAP
jgi:murein DD-endopeptidase MepM/ murein hydrolase activator NlpD